MHKFMNQAKKMSKKKAAKGKCSIDLDRFVDKNFLICHKNDGKVMDVSAGNFNNGTDLIWWQKHGNVNQQFTLKKRGDGCYGRVILKSGRVVCCT